MSNGKGSKSRPLSIPREEYGSRHDRIFRSRHSVSEELPWLVPPPATPKDRTLQEEWNRLFPGPWAHLVEEVCPRCNYSRFKGQICTKCGHWGEYV